jgi:hypothetical protein
MLISYCVAENYNSETTEWIIIKFGITKFQYHLSAHSGFWFDVMERTTLTIPTYEHKTLTVLPERKIFQINVVGKRKYTFYIQSTFCVSCTVFEMIKSDSVTDISVGSTSH